MKQKNNSLFQSGDTIIISGLTEEDRYYMKYTNAQDFIAALREKDDPRGQLLNNVDYMRAVNKQLSSILEQVDAVLPIHSEEAFISALYRLGVFSKAILN